MIAHGKHWGCGNHTCEDGTPGCPGAVWVLTRRNTIKYWRYEEGIDAINTVFIETVLPPINLAAFDGVIMPRSRQVNRLIGQGYTWRQICYIVNKREIQIRRSKYHQKLPAPVDPRDREANDCFDKAAVRPKLRGAGLFWNPEVDWRPSVKMLAYPPWESPTKHQRIRERRLNRDDVAMHQPPRRYYADNTPPPRFRYNPDVDETLEGLRRDTFLEVFPCDLWRVHAFPWRVWKSSEHASHKINRPDLLSRGYHSRCSRPSPACHRSSDGRETIALHSGHLATDRRSYLSNCPCLVWAQSMTGKRHFPYLGISRFRRSDHHWGCDLPPSDSICSQ